MAPYDNQIKAHDETIPWHHTTFNMPMTEVHDATFHGTRDSDPPKRHLQKSMMINSMAPKQRLHSIYQTAESPSNTEVHDDKFHGTKSLAASQACTLRYANWRGMASIQNNIMNVLAKSVTKYEQNKAITLDKIK